MNILIDNREIGPRNLETTRKQRAKTYYTSKNHTATIQQLTYGDYLFNDKVVFEYKILPDFMNSIYDGTLFEEVSNQTDHYDYSFVMVEGEITKYLPSAWHSNPIVSRKWQGDFNSYYVSGLKRYYGAIRRLQTGCVVLNRVTEKQCFMEMLLQAQKCLSNKSYGGVKRGLKCNDNIDYFLSGASGTSSKTIEAINKQLIINCLDDLLTLTIGDLMSVDGVGEVKAIKIYEWIHQRRNDK